MIRIIDDIRVSSFRHYPVRTEPLNKRLGSASVQNCIKDKYTGPRIEPRTLSIESRHYTTNLLRHVYLYCLYSFIYSRQYAKQH